MTLKQWYIRHDVDLHAYRVTEVQANIQKDRSAVRHELADVLVALAHELSESLLVISNCVGGAQRDLRVGWSGLNSMRGGGRAGFNADFAWRRERAPSA